jgi:hypothetical protein
MTFLDSCDADPNSCDDPYPALLFDVYPAPPSAVAKRASGDVRLLLEVARSAGVEDARRPSRSPARAPLLAELKRCMRQLASWRLRKAYP